MAFFDELKKNLSGVTDTVAKTSENVMKKSSTAIEIQKAKLKRVSLEGDMKELYASLGKLYFEEYADGDMPHWVRSQIRTKPLSFHCFQTHFIGKGFFTRQYL